MRREEPLHYCAVAGRLKVKPFTQRAVVIQRIPEPFYGFLPPFFGYVRDLVKPFINWDYSIPDCLLSEVGTGNQSLRGSGTQRGYPNASEEAPQKHSAVHAHSPASFLQSQAAFASPFCSAIRAISKSDVRRT